MTDHVYKTIELYGSSSEGLQQAIENAVAKAAKTVHNMRWFQMMEVRGHLDKGAIEHWQVGIKVGFTIED